MRQLQVEFTCSVTNCVGMRLLVVEDDRALATVLRRALVDEGYAVDVAHRALVADEMVSINDYSLIVLDLGLPDGDGQDLCVKWRNEGNTSHILMLTARDARLDRIGGLDAGADDYVTKPFDYDEFAARVRALLRRPRAVRRPSLTVGDLTLDPATRSVTRGDVQVALTAREFTLLRLLLTKAGEVVERGELMEQAWDAHYEGLSNTLEVHIASLRRKLELPGRPAPIETVRGVGYRVTAVETPAFGGSEEPESDISVPIGAE
jgi:DNA-binding response OmpR family regulator